MSLRKSKEIGNRVLYCAKDVFNTLGVKYRGAESFKGLEAGFATTKFLTKVGKHDSLISQYALDEAGVREICTRLGKSPTLVGLKPAAVDTSKEIAAMKQTINDLKNVVAQLLTQNDAAEKTLKTDSKTVKVIKDDKLQIEARKQTREIVQDYASKRATELGITEGDSRRIFFDLSFKALYNAYKLATNIDLKAMADTETADTGNKVSGLQIAERLGRAIDLLQFTKAFYKNN